MKKNKKIFAVPAYLNMYGGGARDMMKFIAAVLMVFDHMAYAGMIMPEFHNIIGRAVFPVFAYSLGCFLTSNAQDIKKYILKMLPFAVIAQPVHYMFIGPMESGLMMFNVLFTLILSAGLGYLLLYKNIATALKHAVMISLLIFGNLPVPLEYHFTGVVMPIAFAMFFRGDKYSAAYLIGCFLMLNAPVSDIYTELWFKNLFLKALFTSAGFYAVYKSSPFIAADFRKTKRFLPPLFLYVFYPLHILVLIILKIIPNM